MNIINILNTPIVLTSSLFIAVIFVIVFIAKLVKNSSTPYQRIKTLFTPAELNFLKVLEKAINKNTVIYGKVRMADVVSTKKGLNKRAWITAFNRTACKHFDFVLCDRSGNILCVIELDDRSHLLAKAKKNDEFKNKVCKNVELRLIRITAARHYDLDSVKKQIMI